MRTGIWLIGARGSVAVTATVGALALQARLVDSTGCVTELPQLSSPALPAWTDLVIGGHDIVATPVLKKADTLAAAGVLPARLVAALTDQLTAHEENVRPWPTGTLQWNTSDLKKRAAVCGWVRRRALGVSPCRRR